MKTRDATAADIDFLANAFLRAMRPYITAARGSWDQVKEDRQFRAASSKLDTHYYGRGQ